MIITEQIGLTFFTEGRLTFCFTFIRKISNRRSSILLFHLSVLVGFLMLPHTSYPCFSIRNSYAYIVFVLFVSSSQKRNSNVKRLLAIGRYFFIVFPFCNFENSQLSPIVKQYLRTFPK